MRRLAALLALFAGFAATATATAEAKPLVRYEFGGGLGGIGGALTLAGDGRATQSDARRGDDHRFTLYAKQLRGLRRDLRNARFQSLKRSYRPKNIVNDGIAQSVTYRGRSVTVSTGARCP